MIETAPIHAPDSVSRQLYLLSATLLGLRPSDVRNLFLDATGITATLYARTPDGHKLGNGTHEVHITVDDIGHTEAPTVATVLHIDLTAQDVTTLAQAGAELLLTSETRDALVAMGWTPPPGT